MRGVSEESFRLIVETIPGLIAVMTPAGEVEHVNRRVLEYFGRTLDELKQWGTTDAVHPADLPRVKAAWQHAVQTGQPYEFEHRIRRRDGEYRWFQSRGLPLRDVDGRIVRWYSLLTDIEEIKRLKDRLQDENFALREEIDQASMFEEIVGASAALKAVLSHVSKVAPTDSTVLISGETGTGKELIARAIHRHSRRADRAFVSLNCAATPPSLIASELFGHEKGAFTGAAANKAGLLEVAHQGTVFLDEIGDMDLQVQAKLLKVLEEKRFRRLGDVSERQVNVRLIAATHQDLGLLTQQGKFRSDLYYRISTIPLVMPSLRERAEDIPILAQYFLDAFAIDLSRRELRLAPDAERALQSYSWPGNIRELRNVLERGVLLSDSNLIRRHELRLDAPLTTSNGELDLNLALAEVERRHIERVLAAENGHVERAAVRLGIPRSTLYQKIKSLRIGPSKV